MKKLEYPIVEVFWQDASSIDHHTTWGEYESVIERATNHTLHTRSVGYLISKSSDRIVLAGSLAIPDPDDPPTEVSGTMVIPRKMIREMKTLSGVYNAES